MLGGKVGDRSAIRGLEGRRPAPPIVPQVRRQRFEEREGFQRCAGALAPLAESQPVTAAQRVESGKVLPQSRHEKRVAGRVVGQAFAGDSRQRADTPLTAGDGTEGQMAGFQREAAGRRIGAVAGGVEAAGIDRIDAQEVGAEVTQDSGGTGQVAIVADAQVAIRAQAVEGGSEPPKALLAGDLGGRRCALWGCNNQAALLFHAEAVQTGGRREDHFLALALKLAAILELQVPRPEAAELNLRWFPGC